MVRRSFLILPCLLFLGFWGWQLGAHVQARASQQDTTIFLPLIVKPHPQPAITSFVANTAIADPGDTIALSWETTNAVSNTLYHLLPTGQLGSFWHVTATGTITYTIPTTARNVDRFALFADNPYYAPAMATVSIALTCPHSWFFAPAPDICPQDAALITNGAEQWFEHGVMIWVEAEGMIYVLFDDTGYTIRWKAYLDTWNPGDPIDDPAIVPPSGFYQPLRGFGLVWREEPDVRARLGWAVAPETGTVTAVQRTSYARYNDIYIRAADDNVWWLWTENSGWGKVIVTP